MQIIAKTGEGFLIQASKNEVSEILLSVTGQEQKEIGIGQKIPAIDYAGSISKIKGLSKSAKYSYLRGYINDFVVAFNALHESIEAAASLEL